MLVLSHSVTSNSLQPHGLQPVRLPCPWRFSRQEYWSGLPCPRPGNLPNPGIKPRSPILQVDSLPLSHQGSPLGLQYSYTEVSSLSFLQGNFPTQESNQGLLHCRWILYQLSYQGIPIKSLCYTSETNVTLCVDCFSISSQYTFSINVSQCITL